MISWCEQTTLIHVQIQWFFSFLIKFQDDRKMIIWKILYESDSIQIFDNICICKSQHLNSFTSNFKSGFSRPISFPAWIYLKTTITYIRWEEKFMQFRYPRSVPWTYVSSTAFYIFLNLHPKWLFEILAADNRCTSGTKRLCEWRYVGPSGRAV